MKNIIIALTLISLPANAALNFVDTSTIRSLPSSETDEWDVFQDAFAIPNTGDVSSDAGITLTQTTPGAVLTSGGNIYAPGTLTTYALEGTAGYVNVSSNVFIGNIVLQLGTFGSIIDYQSMTLTYVDSTSASYELAAAGFESDSTIVSFIPPGGPPVTSTDDLVAYQWNLSGLDAVSFSIEFESEGTSLSLDRAALDTVSTQSPFQTVVSPLGAVPEPSTSLLISIAAISLLIRRRRSPSC